MEKNKRSFGLDLIRALAVILVILNHVFYHKEFTELPVVGMRNFLLLLLRHITLLCVPLFLMLTGYCQANKKDEKNYYKSIKRIIISYIGISIICILYKVFLIGEPFNPETHIMGIFNFSTIGYSWYVEMYIGLFFLIPYLNLIYKNIETKEKKQNLIIILLCLTSIPVTIGGLLIGNYRLELLPNWWSILYPLVYYFIGSYIREYKINLNRPINILLIIGCLFMQTMIIYCYLGGDKSYGKLVSGYQSIFIVIASTLTFILLYKQKIRGNIIRKGVELLSKNSFEIYLFSFIADNFIYYYLGFNNKMPTYSLTILVCVPIILVLSIVASLLFNLLIKKIKELRIVLKQHHEKKYQDKEAY